MESKRLKFVRASYKNLQKSNLNKTMLKLNLIKNLSIPIQIRHVSSSTAIVTKIHRQNYARDYQTILVNPDGSSINIRYHEPRKIIRLPLDLSLLSEAERKARVEKRKPKTRVKIEEDIKDNFSANKYLKYMKKKK